MALRDPYSTTIEELRSIEARIAELRDGDALARAHVHMIERMNLLELELVRLRDHIEEIPERAAASMLAALKAANLLKKPSERGDTVGG